MPIRKTVQTVRLSRKKPEAAFTLLTGVVFTAAIAFFFIANLLVPDTKFSEEENRMLQTFPEFSVSEYLSGRYEAQIEDYSNDQFLGRKAFIRVKAAADLTEGKVEANGVWKGKDGYLLEDITTPEKGFTERTAEALGSFKKAHPKLRMSFLLVPNPCGSLRARHRTTEGFPLRRREERFHGHPRLQDGLHRDAQGRHQGHAPGER